MAVKETLAIGADRRSDRAREELGEIFVASYRRLVAQLSTVVGDAVEAENLVHEAFVRASALGARFRRVDDPEAWLRRTAIDLHRSRRGRLRQFGGPRSRPVDGGGPTGLEDPLVGPPDYDTIAWRGQRRRRRRALAGGVLAGVLVVTGAVRGAVTGDVAGPDRDRKVDVTVPPPARGAPYPVATMEDLAPGTYELTPSANIGHPRALVTVPAGWNAAEGPERFSGHAPGRSNGQAPKHLTWYAGLLVLEPTSVAAPPCIDGVANDRVVGYMDFAAQARVVSQVPGFDVISAPETVTRFGHSAVHLRVRTVGGRSRCTEDDLFVTVRNPGIAFSPDRATSEVWVVDVDGDPLIVLATRWGLLPPRVARQLTDLVDSVTFVDG